MLLLPDYPKIRQYANVPFTNTSDDNPKGEK